MEIKVTQEHGCVPSSNRGPFQPLALETQAASDGLGVALSGWP